MATINFYLFPGYSEINKYIYCNIGYPFTIRCHLLTLVNVLTNMNKQ